MSQTNPHSGFNRGIIHEGEYVSIPARLSLPINSSTDSFQTRSPSSNTPVRLNSPNLTMADVSLQEAPRINSYENIPSSPVPTHHFPVHVRNKSGSSAYPSSPLNDNDSVMSNITPPILPTTPFSILSTNSSEHTPTLLHKWTHTHSILCVVPAPQKKLIFCGTQDSKILVYDMIDYTLKHEINCGQQNHAASILTLTISNDENYLFSAGSDSLVKVWDLSGIKKVQDRTPEDNDFYLNAASAEQIIHCTHIIFSVVDIGDIFSIAWCDALSTIFIGAQNASILWCHLSLNSEVSGQGHASSNVERLPHFRYDKFFDSKGPGGSINTLQTKHQLFRKYSSSTHTVQNGPKLIEVKSEDIIRFAHNGYVYCMDVFRCLKDLKNNDGIPLDSPEPETSAATDFSFHYADKYENVMVSCGGDGFVNIWGINRTSNGLAIAKIETLDNEESVLSMSIQGSHLYVGRIDSTINVWDLMTSQLIRSFHFTGETKGNSSYDEVLSLGIYNDCIFKASNLGGLVKFTLKSYAPQSSSLDDATNVDTGNNNHTELDKHSTVIISTEDEPYNDIFNKNHKQESKLGAVLAVKIFADISGSTFLLSGGHKALCLWDIHDVGKVTRPSQTLSDGITRAPNRTVSKYSNEELLKSLHKFISFKTISKFPTLYLEDSRHCAQFLCKLLFSLGAYQTKLLPVPHGNPIVYSTFRRNSKVANSSEKPTRVLWYAHYDVVDATNHEAADWDTDPFVLTARDGNLYARGVSDNKGPTLASIYAVADLFHNEELSCDVVFVIEGEEECGSIGFQNVINANKGLIGDIDWVMLSNSYWLDDETPCLNYGLRGVINAAVTIKSDKPDRHSGVDGGVSKEPTMDLIQIVGQLVDPVSNEIKLEGFYDDVLPLTNKEVELYQNIESAAINRNVCNQDLKTLMAKWRNPSLTIHKIQVSGPNNNTVIPQVAKATISIRIVPNQDLEKVKQSLVDKLTSSFEALHSDNRISVNIFHEAEPWLGDPTNLVYSILYEKIKRNWGQTEPLFIREGGSIPSIRFLEKCFDAPAAQIPCGQASDNAHLKDEKLRILNLYKMRSILTETLRELGQ
ncbi:Metalloexopeptidase [Scheffersomyces xylosifermentans]|uniref:Metalloexopeptidase n=1 Tax=Scheffersomyces xylosifermentans TaxID=1304137 RepID=UPI00315D50D6